MKFSRGQAMVVRRAGRGAELQMDFSEKLISLVAAELALAEHDPRRLDAAIAALAEQAGTALAAAFRNDVAGLDRAAAGLEAIIHRQAVLRVEMIRSPGGRRP